MSQEGREGAFLPGLKSGASGADSVMRTAENTIDLTPQQVVTVLRRFLNEEYEAELSPIDAAALTAALEAYKRDYKRRWLEERGAGLLGGGGMSERPHPAPDPCDNAWVTHEAQVLHKEAMERAEEAARMQREAASLLREALQREAAAAELLADRRDLEPSRSVLYRSAAFLAMELGEYYEAMRLAECGLDGNPPDEIRGELEELLAQIRTP